MAIRVLIPNNMNRNSSSIVADVPCFSRYVENLSDLDACFSFEQKTALFFFSDGAWSSIDLLMYLFSKVEKVKEICIATYSISEKVANKLQFLLSQNKNLSIYLLVDWKMKLKNPHILMYLKNVGVKVGLADAHAKLTCIVGRETLTVLSSANYSNNKRFEAGVLVSDKDTSAMYVDKIKQLVDDGAY